MKAMSRFAGQDSLDETSRSDPRVKLFKELSRLERSVRLEPTQHEGWRRRRDTGARDRVHPAPGERE